MGLGHKSVGHGSRLVNILLAIGGEMGVVFRSSSVAGGNNSNGLAAVAILMMDTMTGA